VGPGSGWLETSSAGSAAQVDSVGQRSGRYERERDGFTHPQHLHQHVQVSRPTARNKRSGPSEKGRLDLQFFFTSALYVSRFIKLYLDLFL
jgi:hypothetical protein